MQGNIAAIAKVIDAILVSQLMLKLEAAIAARQEAEARALHLEDRLKQAASPTGPGGVTQGNIAAIAKVIEAILLS